MVDLFLTNSWFLISQDVNLWTGVVWIVCGLLWCFYQLSFWRYPFTAEDPLIRKSCNAEFLQICSNEETNLSTSWVAWEYIFKQMFMFGWTISLMAMVPRWWHSICHTSHTMQTGIICHLTLLTLVVNSGVPDWYFNISSMKGLKYFDLGMIKRFDEVVFHHHCCCFI